MRPRVKSIDESYLPSLESSTSPGRRRSLRNKYLQSSIVKPSENRGEYVANHHITRSSKDLTGGGVFSKSPDVVAKLAESQARVDRIEEESIKVDLPIDLTGLRELADSVRKQPVEVKKEEGEIVLGIYEAASMFALSRDIVQSSDWDGDVERKLFVIKCLTASLSLNEEVSKKRKI
jgi:hypothetical protein